MWEFLRGKKDGKQEGTGTTSGGTGSQPRVPASTSGTPTATTAGEAQDQHAAGAAKPKGFLGRILDMVLGDKSGKKDEEGQRQVAERNEAGVEDPKPVPGDYDAYAAHLKDKFGDDFEAMAKHREKFDAEGGAEKRKTQKLALTPEEIEQAKDDLEAKKASGATEDDIASEQAKIKAMEQALPNANRSMPELLGEAQKLKDQIAAGNPKDPAVVAAKAQLEGVMQASMILGKQIDPVGTEMGRLLYNKIDKEENPALTDQAREEGTGEEDVAKGAVNQRNWLRHFVRSEMMDPTHAEILYQRDEGKTGSREGMSFEQVQSRQVAGLKKEGELPADFDMATASEEQRNLVFGKVIGSAKQTNPGVNASTTGSATGMKDPEKEKDK